MLSRSQTLVRASKGGARRLHAAIKTERGRVSIAAKAATTLAFGVLSYAFLTIPEIHNDAVEPLGKTRGTNIALEPTAVTELDDDGTLRTLGWGINRSKVLSPDIPEGADISVPTALEYLESVALRDFALHGHHGACVDARGDIYQWGLGFFGKEHTGDKRPVRTLQGKNIIKLQATSSRIFALSSSGRVYVIPAKQQQEPLSRSWGWLLGGSTKTRSAELEIAQKLGWGEKIIDISAGRDHLLALTSSGRALALPATLQANSHGQLGYRKIEVSDPSSRERIAGELTPVAVADPYANASRFSRKASSSGGDGLQPVSEGLKRINDLNITWSIRLSEIPALRGVRVTGIAAGARSSYALTDQGRVLAWGANDHGQLGLRNTVSGDTVTVPAEVVFSYDTKCTSITAGGDLVFFATEKRDGTSITTAELYACGDGQYGGLGTAIFTSAQISPARTRAVSGLVEYSEANGNLQPISARGLSVSTDGHILCSLDTRSRAGPGGGGMDLLAWGNNYEHQLGNGRRASVAIPENVTLKPGSARFMLRETRAREVRDLEGRVWGRRVKVEQTAYAGPGTSVVYWKLV